LQITLATLQARFSHGFVIGLHRSTVMSGSKLL
jgi:hypothetical protein